MKRSVPENIWRLMSHEDRVRYSQTETSEFEMHDKYTLFLRSVGLGYYHCDPTKPATIAPGTPDFGVYRESRIMWIEFKAGLNGLSPVQDQKIAAMVADRNVVFVCRSVDDAEALTRKFFHLKT